MNLRTLCVALVVTVAVVASTRADAAKLRVVATTQDLASLATEVGGDRIDIQALAKGYQDPHFVEPKPSFILALNKADLLIVVGRELEIGWLPPLIQQSRNSKIQPGADGYLDASLTVKILEIPTGQITRAMGDVHPMGNPHYWLDPENGRRIAQAVEKKLAAMQPADASYFAGRLADFEKRLTDAEKRWDSAMAPLRGMKIVTYHRSWPNFAEHFGLDVIGYIEPRPGIPPSPSHTLELTAEMKRQNVKLMLVEPYFDTNTPDAIARDTGAKVLIMSPSVGGQKDVTDYFKLFDYDINLFTSAARQVGSR